MGRWGWRSWNPSLPPVFRLDRKSRIQLHRLGSIPRSLSLLSRLVIVHQVLNYYYTSTRDQSNEDTHDVTRGDCNHRVGLCCVSAETTTLAKHRPKGWGLLSGFGLTRMKTCALVYVASDHTRPIQPTRSLLCHGHPLCGALPRSCLMYCTAKCKPMGVYPTDTAPFSVWSLETSLHCSSCTCMQKRKTLNRKYL